MNPLRELALDQVEGCRVLSHGAIAWQDGSEDRLLEIVRDARDLSSLSDELEQAVTSEGKCGDRGRKNVDPRW